MVSSSKQYKNILLFTSSLITATLLTGCGGDSVADANNAKADLGKALFTSKELSQNKTMSCATCHDLEHGMADARAVSSLGGSLGDDNVSHGDCNAPTASYAAFSPEFHFDADEQLYIGGQFLDGRASDLKAQAKGPFLNPIEIGMPDGASVVARAKAVPTLASQLKAVYGADIFNNERKAYDSIADAIATFEKTKEFSPFDSKFDRAYEGSYSYTALEAKGKNSLKAKDSVLLVIPLKGVMHS